MAKHFAVGRLQGEAGFHHFRNLNLRSQPLLNYKKSKRYPDTLNVGRRCASQSDAL